MAHTTKETLTIGWCDNGSTDGKFTQGLLSIAMHGPQSGIPIVGALRVQGNQIGRQRQVLFDGWADQNQSDWLLWVDSDIVVTPEVVKILWESADKLSRPVVCGVYFVSKENEQSLMQPMPAIFINGETENEIRYVHPLPQNELIKVDCAGLGLTLMHKSVIDPLRKITEGYSIFAEKEGIGEQFVSEDIVFYKNLKKAKIPVYAHTGALVQHMKRFSFDVNYYGLYWNNYKHQ
jgi:hypothetical protein